MIISVTLIVIAATLYPGGSLLNQNSVGFGWSRNFISNLFSEKAINGQENPGRIWAIFGMVFQSIGYGIFFINMSKKISLTLWKNLLKYIGYANIILIPLIATPFHDLGTFSIVLTLFGIFIITIFVFKSKLLLLKFCCSICLLAYYSFFFFYGFSYIELALIMQKIYSISSIVLVIGLEYLTKSADFDSAKWDNKKMTV